MRLQLTQEVLDKNVTQVTRALIDNGLLPDPLPDIGGYTWLLQTIAKVMLDAPHRLAREGMLKAIRHHPNNKPYDELLKRGFDPQPAKPPVKQGLDPQPAKPPVKRGFDPQPAKPPVKQGTDPQPAKPASTVEIISEEITAPPLDYSILDPELARGACPWLDEAYVPFSRMWSPRAPDIHHIGCGLWVLSTLAMRRLAAKEGRTIQPTPLYIQLVAPSSVWGKTTTARIAVDLLENLHLDWILSPNMVTPEKFLKNMATMTVPANYGTLDDEQKEQVRTKLAHCGQRGWYYSEFGQLLREMSDSKGRNALFKSILLRMDDCENTSRYDTIGRDLEEIHLPYLTLLGTMTPDCMKAYSGSDSSSWGDGFYARFAFCCVPLHRKKTQQDLEREEFPQGEGQYGYDILRPLWDFHSRLKRHQCEIEAIEDEKGGTERYKATRLPISRYPITVLPLHAPARRALNDYGNALALRAQDEDLAQFRSYYSRLRDKTLRIATLFAGLQHCHSIELRHIARAQQIAEEFRQSIHQLGAHLGQWSSSSKQQDDKILRVLRAKDVPLTVREICQHIRGMDAKEARERLDTLELAGIVGIQEKGRSIYYVINTKV
jgi:Protein of unknown function (DUF3987)